MRTLPRKPAGFTLVEVMLAIAIFVFLVGGVYLTVSTSVQAGAALGDHQITQRGYDALETFLRDGFRNLPAEADMELRSRDEGRLGRSVQLIIRHATGGFGADVLDALGSNVVVAVQPDGKGKARFCLMKFSDRLSEDELTRVLGGGGWLPLMDGVETVRWRFHDPNINEFSEIWERGRGRPDLIELTYTAAGEERVSMFRIPAIKKGEGSEDGGPQPSPSPSPQE